MYHFPPVLCLQTGLLTGRFDSSRMSQSESCTLQTLDPLDRQIKASGPGPVRRVQKVVCQKRQQGAFCRGRELFSLSAWAGHVLPNQGHLTGALAKLDEISRTPRHVQAC